MTVRIPIERCKDPFIMDENTVNLAVSSYFENKGVDVKNVAKNKERGFDVYGEKNGYSLIVESKGSLGNNQCTYVFGTGQLKNHLSAQIFCLMKHYEYSSGKTILIMANPDIPRIRNMINEVSLSLDELEFVRFWVNSQQIVQVECPDELTDLLERLGLM
ncbi:hypothetical protein MKX40_22330 [Paenibacillus sp. FSL R5-0517]|uniref:hypothetical protein n=1 Tax=Paenibacillus sp. FSL R5-0517 TaxID=2921647 RepID=UPI0030D7EAD7